MSIGIYDADWSLDRVVPFNLQAMKLSAYYKRKREIVQRDRDFRPDKHSLVYVCKDFDDGNYPEGLLSSPNVKLIGRAFTGGIYQPMPMEIEMTAPDTHFYEKDEPILARTISKGAGRLLHSMAAAEHLRWSLDGTNVWDQYTSQITYRKRVWNVILHDDNLAQIKDGPREFEYLYNYLNGDKTKLRLGCKFPIWCTNAEQLMIWSQIRSSRTFYAIGMHGMLADDELDEWLSLPWFKLTPRIIRLDITPPGFDYQSFINGGINQLYHQAVKCRSENAILLLKYEKGYFRDKRWTALIDLFTQFQQWRPKSVISNEYIARDTMLHFVRWLPANEFELLAYINPNVKLPTKDELRPLFAFLKNNNPDLFSDFYTLSYNSLKEV